ncbi:MAG: 50S ribosomal protein L25 [Planctomycetota bacterium]|nr:50S ribosomal protein L25 [Planctomycetota bacterium]
MTEVLKVEKREGKGKYRAFEMRKTGQIPGVVYGKGMAGNINVKIDLKEFLHLLKTGERIIDLDIDGTIKKVLIKAVQHGTYDHEILHADFRAISDTEVIEVDLLIELKGEAPGTHVGGMVEQDLHQVTVRCLPADMPEAIIIDISNLQVGEILYAEDLPKLKGVAYIFHGNPAVVSCHQPAGEKVAVAEEDEAPTAPEVIGEKEREAKATDEK